MNPALLPVCLAYAPDLARADEIVRLISALRPGVLATVPCADPTAGEAMLVRGSADILVIAEAEQPAWTQSANIPVVLVPVVPGHPIDARVAAHLATSIDRQRRSLQALRRTVANVEVSEDQAARAVLAVQVPRPDIAFPAVLPPLEAWTDALVGEALRRTDGNMAAAARLLGVTRQAVQQRVKQGRI